jgi:hypothetical protein
MHEEPRIPERLPLLVVPDGVLLPGASMRFLAASPAALALVRNRLLSRGSLGRYHSSRFEGTSVVDRIRILLITLIDPDSDLMRVRIRLFTLMRIQIQILASKKAQSLEKLLK